MRPIGAKTLMSLMLLGGGVALTIGLGVLRLDRLQHLTPWVAFLVGSFATLAGSSVFSFWRLWEKSEYYFGTTGGHARADSMNPDASLMLEQKKRRLTLSRGGRKHGVDLPPFLQRAVYILIFLGLGLITIQNRSFALLVDFPEKLAKSGNEYCEEAQPDEDYEAPEMQGCRLVVRAYELGYKKSLGDCARKTEDDVPEVCTLRQHDEPYLHYSWRLLTARTDSLRDIANRDEFHKLKNQFEQKVDHLESLVRDQRDTVAANPRASHHLFTNVRDPRRTLTQKAARLLSLSNCVERYAKMPHLAPAGVRPDARFLDHALGQLLFNPTYKPVGGHCQEFTVHWDAPKDACQQLADSPEAFLAENDALQPVRRVLARHRRKLELNELALALDKLDADDAQPHNEPAAPERIVSFQCFVVGKTSTAKARDVDVTLDGYSFAAREIHAQAASANGQGQIEFLQRLATLLAPGFRYGRLVSRESIIAQQEHATLSSQYDNVAFSLTKLEFLRDADLFLGNQWIERRSDLLQVYPFHLHLQSFVQVFRRAYRVKRGRL